MTGKTIMESEDMIITCIMCIFINVCAYKSMLNIKHNSFPVETTLNSVISQCSGEEHSHEMLTRRLRKILEYVTQRVSCY